LNEQGYYVSRRRNLYWITDGTYSAFLTTSTASCCSARRRPPAATSTIDEIAAANGVSNKVNSSSTHHHADHVGVVAVRPERPRIGHEETRKLLLRRRPSQTPNEETFQDAHPRDRRRVGLAWYGANHSPDNIIIHLLITAR
jgi:hypothetical protein